MDNEETFCVKGNLEEEKNAGKKHGKKRNLESLDDCTSHEADAECCAQRSTKKSKKDESREKKTDRAHEIKKHDKKRKGEGMEDIEKHKKRKVDGVEGVVEHKKKIEGNDTEEKQKKRKRQDTEEDEKQVKKKKREGIKKERKSFERMKDFIKKWNWKDKEGHEERAKKKKEDKKRTGWDSGGVLRLKVDAKTVSKERDVKEYTLVHIEKGNLIDATVGGHRCAVYLDTGASLTTMFLPVAERMGLVTGNEETVKIPLMTWFGLQEVDVIELAEVVVVLKGGVAVNTPLTVFPQEMQEEMGLGDEILMSMSRLQEAEMRQEFHPDDSSTLFLCHPEHLQRRPEQGRHGKVLMFAARTKGIDESLKVLVDTGAKALFCITETGLDKVQDMTDRWTLPLGQVLMQFSCSTEALLLHKVEPNQVKIFDFVFGRLLLGQLQATIDYVDLSMTLKLNEKQIRIELQPYSGRLAAWSPQPLS